MSEEIIRGPLEVRRGEQLDECLDSFTFEVALLFFRMRTAATQYLGRGEHSSGHRSILKRLGVEGPQTVPAMARVRSVSRQHVQKLVDGLKADGLVAATPNPDHKRSVLIALTRRGESYLRELRQRETELWQFLGRDLAPERIDDAAEVVRTLRSRFESSAWLELAGSD